jgi:hypothetical protein
MASTRAPSPASPAVTVACSVLSDDSSAACLVAIASTRALRPGRPSACSVATTVSEVALSAATESFSVASAGRSASTSGCRRSKIASLSSVEVRLIVSYTARMLATSVLSSRSTRPCNAAVEAFSATYAASDERICPRMASVVVLTALMRSMRVSTGCSSGTPQRISDMKPPSAPHGSAPSSARTTTTGATHSSSASSAQRTPAALVRSRSMGSVTKGRHLLEGDASSGFVSLIVTSGRATVFRAWPWSGMRTSPSRQSVGSRGLSACLLI